MNNEKQKPKNENSQEFDKKAEAWYNNNKDADGVVRINMKNAPRLNDPKCQHKWYLDETDADSSWVDVWKCTLCPMGILTEKQTQYP